MTDINGDNRPIWMPDDCNILVADAKSVASIDRSQAQCENLKYYLQDPFYSTGVSTVLGGKVCFVFMFVSTTLSLGRYPAQAAVLDDVYKFEGRAEMRSALSQYQALMNSGNEAAWQTLVTIDRPHWAINNDDTL